MIPPYIGRYEQKISLAKSASWRRRYEENRGKKRRRELKNILPNLCKYFEINAKLFRVVQG